MTLNETIAAFHNYKVQANIALDINRTAMPEQIQHTRNMLDSVEKKLSQLQMLTSWKCDIKINVSERIDHMVSINLINTIVTKTLALSIDQIYSPCRSRECANARFIAWTLIKEQMPKFPTDQMAIIYGQRDGSTVRSGLKSARDYYRTDANFRDDLNLCRSLVHAHLHPAEQKVEEVQNA